MRPPAMKTGQAAVKLGGQRHELPTRPLRILVDGRVMQDRYHGIGRYTFELLRELSKHNVDLIILHNPDTGRMDLRELLAHPAVRLVPCMAPVVSLRTQWVLARATRAFRPDVLFIPYHLATPVLHGPVPIVSVIHDCIFEQHAATGGRSAFSVAYGAATRLAIWSATALAAPSHAAMHDINHFYKPGLHAGSVLPHGVSDGFFTLAGRPRPPDLHLPDRYILHVGAQRPHKNQRVLVEALAVLRRTHPELGLVLVGQPDPRFPDDVGRIAESLGVARHVRRYADLTNATVMDLYANAAVFGYPSLIEGFGLPVLEAMAAGLPVVASDAEAVREVAGKGAAIVPAQAIGCWVQALDRVLTDEDFARGLRERAQAVAAEHTWAQSASRTLAMLVSVAASGERRGEHRA
jgi:glycosyltransferase involved in cell wall biosynthesis